MKLWFLLAASLAFLVSCGDADYSEECKCHMNFRDSCAYSLADQSCKCTLDGKVVTPDDPKCN